MISLLSCRPRPILVRASFTVLTLTAGGASLAHAQPTGSATVAAPFFDGIGTPAAVAIQPDGRVVAAGSVPRAGATDSDFAVMRFETDGTPDPGFGTAGRVTTDFSGASDVGRAVAIQPDGAIVVAGSTVLPPNPTCPGCPETVVALARYTSSGSLDPSFGVGGRVTREVGGGSGASAVAIAANGDILVAATHPGSTFTTYQWQRFSASGWLLAVGYVNRSLQSLHPFAFGSGGTMVTLGLSDAVHLPHPGPPLYVPRLTRYTAAGVLDTTFAGRGFVDFIDAASGVAVQPDDKPVVVGETVIERFTATGALDASFGNGGKVRAGFGALGNIGNLRTVAAEPDGSITAAGSSGPEAAAGGGVFGILRTTREGLILDRVTVDFGGNDYADAIGRSGSELVVAGFSVRGGSTLIAWTPLGANLWRPLTPSALTADWDGDRRSDIILISNTGEWRIADSSTWFVAREAYLWGASNDVPVTADFDGDGRIDLAVYRPETGVWYVIDPPTGRQSAYQWGTGNDIPVPGDFDGDGRTELAVYRPHSAEWFTYNLATGLIGQYRLGLIGDVPVPRDYDGDGQTDLAVYRPSSGVWTVFNLATAHVSAYQWGAPGDLPVPANYVGDQGVEIAVYRPATGTWWIFDPGTGEYFGAQWGAPGDQPVPGNYLDGERAELAVWRPSTQTSFLYSFETSTYTSVQLGLR
jgi:uncharacterized delta-60 repeat protein